VNIILNGENLKALSLRSGTNKGYLLFLLLFHIVPEVQVRTINQKKERSSIQTRKKNSKTVYIG
jgi:hypothetical protein